MRTVSGQTKIINDLVAILGEATHKEILTAAQVRDLRRALAKLSALLPPLDRVAGIQAYRTPRAKHTVGRHRIDLRADRAWRDRVSRAAAKQGVTISEYIRRAVEETL